MTVLAAGIFNMLPALPAASQESVSKATFEGYHLKSGELAFRGERTLTRSHARTKESVRYFNPAGALTQMLDAEFDTATARLVSYRREFPPTGELETAALEGDRVVMTYRESGKAKLKTEDLDWNEAMVFPPTVVPRMELSWQPLLNGKTLDVEMVVPSRLDSYGFRLVNEGGVDMSGRKALVIRLEAGSALVRRLVDPMRFFWSEEDPRQLLEYQGRTSVRNAEGKQIDARIVYHYGAG